MKERTSILEDSIKKLLSYSIIFFIIVTITGFLIIKNNYDSEITKLEEEHLSTINLEKNEDLQKELFNIQKYLESEFTYLKTHSKEIIDSAYNFILEYKNHHDINDTFIDFTISNLKYPFKVEIVQKQNVKNNYYKKYIKLKDDKYLKISFDKDKYNTWQEQITLKNIHNLHNNKYIQFKSYKLSNNFVFTSDKNWYCEYNSNSYMCYDRNWWIGLKFSVYNDLLRLELEAAKNKLYTSFVMHIIFLLCSASFGFLLLYIYIIKRRDEIKKQIELTSKYFVMILNNEINNFTNRNSLNADFKYKEFRTLNYIFLNFLRTIRAKDKNLKKLAYKDSVTGLMNTTSVYESLGFYEKKDDKELLFCFFNIENFRIYNSMYGREFGDEVLKVVAYRLYSTLKSKDFEENEYKKALEYKRYDKYELKQNKDEFECLARISADEFLLIIEVPKNSNYEKIVTKYQHDLTYKNIKIESNDELIQYDPFKISARVGYSIYPKDTNNIIQCVSYADMALENDKASGGNGVFGYTKEIGEENESNLQLQKDIRNGIINKEFILHYQPKVNCATGEIVGAEALVRWQKNNKIIMPDVFIEICEKSNLIIALGNEIIRMACEAQRRWISQGLRLKLSINLSTKQLLSDGIIQVIEKNIEGIDPSLLEFEITESFSIENETSKEIIDRIKRLNVGLSMDDFGKGYSSLSYLNDQDLDFDVIKIDKCFIQNIDTNEKNRKLVEFIVNLIKTLKKRSVAEGVENMEILNFLKDLGCDEYQGYYFSKPVPEEILIKRVYEHDNN